MESCLKLWHNVRQCTQEIPTQKHKTFSSSHVHSARFSQCKNFSAKPKGKHLTFRPISHESSRLCHVILHVLQERWHKIPWSTPARVFKLNFCRAHFTCSWGRAQSWSFCRQQINSSSRLKNEVNKTCSWQKVLNVSVEQISLCNMGQLIKYLHCLLNKNVGFTSPRKCSSLFHCFVLYWDLSMKIMCIMHHRATILLQRAPRHFEFSSSRPWTSNAHSKLETAHDAVLQASFFVDEDAQKPMRSKMQSTKDLSHQWKEPLEGKKPPQWASCPAKHNTHHFISELPCPYLDMSILSRISIQIFCHQQ